MVAVVLVAVLLVGCGGSQQARLTGVRQAGAAADEPRAVTVARDVLNAGGSAADAAVATALALAVTFPVAANLAGGGMCVVFDGPTGAVESLEFLPRAPKAGGSVAVPGMVRGLATLHARYGRLAWADIVKPAEAIARSGHPVSRAMARNIAAVGDAIGKSKSLTRWLAQGANGLLEEGDGLVQIEISSTLSLLRTRGAGDLYRGFLGRQFVDAARRMGGRVTMQDLRGYAPVWGETAQANVIDLTMHTIPLPVTGGTISGQILLMLSDGERYRAATVEERPHLFAEISLRAFADLRASRIAPMSSFRAHALMRTYEPGAHAAQSTDTPGVSGELPALAGGDGATGFVVGDNDGSAIACNLMLGSPFGIGAWDPVTGMVPAAVSMLGNTHAYSGPVLFVRTPDDHVVFAGAASGGIAAPAALAQVAVATLSDDVLLPAALLAPRVLHIGLPDRVIVEPSIPQTAIDSLVRRNHAVFRAAPIGFVNGLRCLGGLGRGSGGCTYGADPRGSGLNLTQ